MPIVAAGRSAAFLHYRDNNKALNDGELVLMDVGLFCEHYSGNVTRTFPANGRFSEEQRRVYELLLSAQIELIEEVRPGVSEMEIEKSAKRKITSICRELGIVGADASEKLGGFFMPHGLSHHVGCATHDMAGFTSRSIHDDNPRGDRLQPGMVITIEPGIYFNPDWVDDKIRQDPGFAPIVNRDVVARLAGTVGGIRIEDDVLVTEDGREVLSTCPKTVDGLGALFRRE
jgi:Xaa-Pro aminopeptidase